MTVNDQTQQVIMESKNGRKYHLDSNSSLPCSVEPPRTPFVGKPNEPIKHADHECPKE